MGQPKTLNLSDYKKPEFTTDHVDLSFDIQDEYTEVESKVTYTRTPEGKNATELVLDAESPNDDATPYIHEIIANGVPLSADYGDYIYDKDNHQLRIPLPSGENKIDIAIKTHIKPEENAALSGLYKSDSCVVSQCESEGFRRITPFLDRPDVMATYSVRVEADKKDYPVLLSNGNLTNSGQTGNNRHWVEYKDPWPKPSYLFATANGDLEVLEGKYTTKSGRDVNCRVFTELGQKDKAQHALDALKLSMKWDEDVFDCEYDLDDYNIVAVAKFNAGAMENKGLNVFRDSLILASPETATDANYQRITDVIGHEYFHNYSGNRVTLANWFNISLKEGLTVTREQMFTAFTTSDAVQRINAVKMLRSVQFPEDDGPLAHPVLPQSVQSVDNCYTMTIYEKGAEVIRMMGQMMGEDKMVDGIKHYFKAHDGEAVTIKDFVKCMEDVSGLKLSGQFDLWYTQSGRPRVSAQGKYDPDTQSYTLTLEQQTPPTKDQPNKKPMMIPVKTGLVADDGRDLHEETLIMTKARQSFVFQNINEDPAYHSLFRGFSAPVDCNPGLDTNQLYKQLLTDNDGFNRWDAGQKIALNEMKVLYDGYTQTGKMPELSRHYVRTLRQLVNDTNTDPALTALMVGRPGIKELEAALGDNVVPSAISEVVRYMDKKIGSELYQDFKDTFTFCHDFNSYSFDYDSVGKRDLKALCVSKMLVNGDQESIKSAHDFYFAADNMTDKMMAMGSLRDHFTPERDAVFDDFYNSFKDDALTIQKWFTMQAMSDNDDVIDHLTKITQSAEFNWENPGHFGSVYGGFAANYGQFHRKDGKGYEFMADAVLSLNAKNPSGAARLITPLTSWRKYSADHQKLMIGQLDRIAAMPNLQKSVYEKLGKALPDPQERLALGLGSVSAGGPASAPKSP